MRLEGGEPTDDPGSQEVWAAAEAALAAHSAAKPNGHALTLAAFIEKELEATRELTVEGANLGLSIRDARGARLVVTLGDACLLVTVTPYPKPTAGDAN